MNLEVKEEIDEQLLGQLEKLGLLSKVKIDKKNSAAVEAAAKRMAANQCSAATKELRSAFAKSIDGGAGSRAPAGTAAPRGL